MKDDNNYEKSTVIVLRYSNFSHLKVLGAWDEGGGRMVFPGPRKSQKDFFSKNLNIIFKFLMVHKQFILKIYIVIKTS